MKAILNISLALLSTGTLFAEVDRSAAAKKIDALVEKNYAANEVKPNSPASDATFLRRIYLDVAGRIPSAAEAREFLHSMNPDKRSKLIDSLLKSEAHVSHEFNHWADVLRITSRLPGQDASNGAMYASWIKGAIRENMPYDEFVRSLVTADGLIDQNGAVGFYLRDRGMPLDHLATTVQTFLGTQMVCAQCHDHPFDDWTQMDYYKLAAFSTPVDVVRAPKSIDETMRFVNNQKNEKQKAISRLKNKQRELQKKLKKAENPKAIKEEMAEMNQEMVQLGKQSKQSESKARNVQRGLQNLTRNFRNAVVGENTRKTLKLPHDYAYDDAKPNDIVHAATPFGDQIEVSEDSSPIQEYAKWMTSTENPRFTKVIANRMWKRVMGVGMFEPVDNIRDGVDGTNPELLAYLEELMKDLKYDLRAYTQIIYNTQTYQREASAFDMFSGEKYYYPGPRLRRMSAEQVWDSMMTLTRADIDQTILEKYETNDGRRLAWERIEKLSATELIAAQAKVTKFINDTNEQIEDFRTQTTKVIAEKNPKKGEKLANEIAQFNANATRKYAELTYWNPEHMKGYAQTPFRNVPRSLLQQMDRAFPKADIPGENKYASFLQKKKDEKKPKKNIDENQLKSRLGKEGYIAYKSEERFKSRLKAFVRASELPSPAPDGHFLRIFGQSDRDLIENADDSASVPQSLAMMNGTLFNILGDPNSAVSKEVRGAKNDDAVLDALYLSVMTRKPDDHERSLLRAELEASGNEGARSILWTLLNTQQFLFIQ